MKKSGIWKSKLTIAINSISSEDTDKERVMHSKGDNIEFLIYDNTYEVVKELFKSVLTRCQTGLETSMRVTDFIFNCVIYW